MGEKEERLAKLPDYMLKPQPPIQPTAGQPGYQFQPKKKPNKTAGYVALGIAGVAMIAGLIWWSTCGEEPKKPETTEIQRETPADVKLSEGQRMKLYTSLMRRKEMLRPMGAVDNAYKTLAGEYGITVQGVHSVEMEGNSKRWPKD